MMKKEDKLTLVFIILILIILMTFTVSAGFFDWIKKITGEATKTVGLNISIGAGTAPQIINVTQMAAQTLTEGPTSTNLSFNFSVKDVDGYANLEDTVAGINITKSGESTRYNSSCQRTNGVGNYANYSCIIYMWWWDATGTWVVNASIRDKNMNNATNDTTTLTISSNTGFVLGPSILSWGTINAGTTNQTPTGFVRLNNTANEDIGKTNVTINATHLKGETTSSQALWSGNFTVSNNSAGTTECDLTPGGAATAWNMSVTSGLFATVNGSNMSRGNYTLNNGITGQEDLYFCITIVGSELSSQPYSTHSEGAWTIRAVCKSC